MLGLTGDFNGDMVVDAADYVVWRDHLGATDESTISGNGDGMNGVDQADYDLWKANFGTSLPASGRGANVSVPEPAMGFLLSFSAALAFDGRFRRRGA
jgi:hypothetical protein